MLLLGTKPSLDDSPAARHSFSVVTSWPLSWGTSTITLIYLQISLLLCHSVWNTRCIQMQLLTYIRSSSYISSFMVMSYIDRYINGYRKSFTFKFKILATPLFMDICGNIHMNFSLCHRFPYEWIYINSINRLSIFIVQSFHNKIGIDRYGWIINNIWWVSDYYK